MIHETPLPSRLGLMLQRLAENSSFTILDQASFDAFVAGAGLTVLLFAEGPNQHPETWDVSIVLPEILKGLPESGRAGVVVPEAGRVLKTRYGFRRWPTVVILRDGGYLGAIEGMRDWPIFVTEFQAILARPASRPPTVGIEVRSEGSAPTCH